MTRASCQCKSKAFKVPSILSDSVFMMPSKSKKPIKKAASAAKKPAKGVPDMALFETDLAQDDIAALQADESKREE